MLILYSKNHATPLEDLSVKLIRRVDEAAAPYQMLGTLGDGIVFDCSDWGTYRNPGEKNDEIYVKNEELCIRNEEFCIKIDEFHRLPQAQTFT